MFGAYRSDKTTTFLHKNQVLFLAGASPVETARSAKDDSTGCASLEVLAVQLVLTSFDRTDRKSSTSLLRLDEL